MRSLRRVFLVSCLSLLLHTVSAARAGDTIRVSCGIYPYENVFMRVEQDFLRETGIRLVFVTEREKTGADESLRYVLDGKSDLSAAAISWEAWKGIAQKRKSATDVELKGIASRVIGHDVMKVIASQGIGVTRLSNAQLRAAFAGELKNWKEVGGSAQPVRLILQRNYPATNDFFRKFVLKDKEFRTDATIVYSIPEMLAAVAKTPGGLGFTSVRVEAPGTQAIATEDVIGRPITAITRSLPSPDVLKLFDFIHKHP